MPVFPHQTNKMKPDREYAVYEDGPDGQRLTLYSLAGSETITGRAAKEQYTRLRETWKAVKSESTHEGMYHYFEREKPAAL